MYEPRTIVNLPTPARRGFTLIEATISIVIVSVILLAALSTAGATARAQRVIESTSRGPELVRQLMGEILGTAFVDPEDLNASLGRDSGESGSDDRADLDDVDDYDGLVEVALVYRGGSPVPDTTGWTRSVTVRYTNPVTLADMGSTESNLKRVTVTATSPAGEATVLLALRSRYGAGEQPPPVDTTYVSWVGVEIDLGGSGGTASSGVNLLNHVEGSP